MDEGVPGPAITTVSAVAAGEDTLDVLEESTGEVPVKDPEHAEANRIQITAARKIQRDRTLED